MIDQSQIPPEIMALLEELSTGYIAEEENPLLAAQYKTADQMRNTPMPITNSAGRAGVVAANPMQQAAAAIQQYRGGQMQRDSMDQMKGNAGKVGVAQKAAVMAELLRRFQQPAAPTGTVGGLPTPPEPIPFAQEPPWEEPWFEGVPTSPAPGPRQGRKPPPPAPTSPFPPPSATGSW